MEFKHNKTQKMEFVPRAAVGGGPTTWDLERLTPGNGDNSPSIFAPKGNQPVSEGPPTHPHCVSERDLFKWSTLGFPFSAKGTCNNKVDIYVFSPQNNVIFWAQEPVSFRAQAVDCDPGSGGPAGEPVRAPYPQTKTTRTACVF